MLSRWFCTLVVLATSFVSGCAGAGDYSYPVAGDYQLVRFSGHQVTVVLPEGNYDRSQIIPAKVLKIAWNERYVIAEQQGLVPKQANGYEEPVGPSHYWILDAQMKKANGPFDLATFNQKRNEFGIPNSLVLKDTLAYVQD